jgi:hypothetical protein
MAATRAETSTLAVESGELPVSEVSGFAVDFTQFLFEEEDRAAAFSLWSALRGVCGSAGAGGPSGVYSTRRGDVAANGGRYVPGGEDSSGSRALRDVPVRDVLACVSHIARRFAPWALPADGAGVVEQIDRSFAAARAAKLASTAARW